MISCLMNCSMITSGESPRAIRWLLFSAGQRNDTEAWLILFVELSFRKFSERGIEMIIEYVTAVNPATGNVSVNTYLIIFIAAAVLAGGAVAAGIISKKKKK